MGILLLSIFFLSLFGFFNLLGIRKDLVLNHAVYIVIGVCFLFLARKLGLAFFRKNAKFFYWSFTFLLIVTFTLGLEVKGSRRWLELYFFNFQPSEFFKVFFIIFFADYFTNFRRESDDIRVMLKSIFYFILPTFLIFKQPDFGNAIVFSVIYFSLLFMSHIPKNHIVKLILIVVLIAPLGWFTLHDYQKQRIASFLQPTIDTQGASYNMIQAIIATGSGKFLGKGLGKSTQSELLFLPENHTDFAFSSLVEQFGFFGGFCVMIFYLMLVVFLIKKLYLYQQRNDEDDKFKFLFTIGFFTYFTFQTFVNIGMNLGLFPVAGIALPMLSYGGSSIVTFLFALGLLI